MFFDVYNDSILSVSSQRRASFPRLAMPVIQDVIEK